MEFSIRPATQGDQGALLGLIRDHARFERSTATIADAELARVLGMSEPPVRIFVAACVEDVAAFAALTIDYAVWRGRHWAHLDCLYVKADARGRGIGVRLLRHIVRAAREIGADRLEWQTPDWNGRAIDFYRREGAVSVAKMRFTIATANA